MKIQPPPDPSAPLKLLRAGQRRHRDLLRARAAARARPGRASSSRVGALVQEPLTSLMALPAAEHPRRRRTCAASASAPPASRTSRAYLKTILDEAGVDPATVKETNVGFNLMPAMLSKKVDATLGAFWNYEGVDLERRGRDPRDPADGEARRADLQRARSSSAPARTSTRTGASRLRRFMQATARRARGCCSDDPAAGVDALLRPTRASTAGCRRRSSRRRCRCSSPPTPTQPWGWQEPVEWAPTSAGCAPNDLLKRPPNDAPPLTNEFLPGEGLGSRAPSSAELQVLAARPPTGA